MTRRKTDTRHPRPPRHRHHLPYRFDDWAAI